MRRGRAISWLYATIATCVWLGVYLSARYGAGTKANLGDSLKTFSIYSAIRSVVFVGLAEPAHPKNFVPQLLVIATPRQWRAEPGAPRETGAQSGAPPTATAAATAAATATATAAAAALPSLPPHQEPLTGEANCLPLRICPDLLARGQAAPAVVVAADEAEFAVDAPLLRLAATLTGSRYLLGGLGYAVVAAVAVGRRHTPAAERARRVAAGEAVIERRIRDVTGPAHDRMFAEVRPNTSFCIRIKFYT